MVISCAPAVTENYQITQSISFLDQLMATSALTAGIVIIGRSNAEDLV